MLKSFSSRPHEFFRRDLSLPEQASQRANLYLGMHRYNAALGAALHDQMAAILSDPLKTQLLQSAPNLCTRNMRQLRHAPVLAL